MPLQNDHETVTALRWLPADGLIEKVESLIDSHGHRTSEITRARSGLSLLTVRDGALGQRWHVGEMPVTSAHLRVDDPDGRHAEGGACILADDLEWAWALAAADAILQGRLSGYEELRSLVDEGLGLREEEFSIRRTMRGRTKVDFRLLSEGREEEE